jgi:UDP-3-O-acyl-N-acetylglucosamine deacetylase
MEAAKLISKVNIEGNCLGGYRGRVEIRHADRFALCLLHDHHAPVEISLEIEKISVENHLVAVGGRSGVRVVEHLFSALYGLNQFNVHIDVYGEEMPFFDGSSVDFVRALKKMNTEHVAGIRFHDNVMVNDEHGSLLYTPTEGEELFVEMTLSHSYIGVQDFAMRITPDDYAREIAPARTFVFTDEDDVRLKDLPPYGIGITSNNIYARSPLRFPDEPVRHKLLDLLGDLYVLKKPINGKITGRNTSHQLNLSFVRKLLAAQSMSHHDGRFVRKYE